MYVNFYLYLSAMHSYFYIGLQQTMPTNSSQQHVTNRQQKTEKTKKLRTRVC